MNEKDETTPSERKKWLGLLWVGGPAVLIACGCMFLAGYWGYLRINFLEYITLDDVLARSVFDVVAVVAFTMMMGAVIFVASKSKKLNEWMDKKEKEAMMKVKPGSFQHRMLPYRDYVLPFISFFITTLMLIWSGIEGEFIGGFVACIPLLSAALAAPFLAMRFKEIRLESGWVIGLIIGLIPTGCYLRGEALAEHRRLGIAPFEPEYFLITESDDRIKQIMPDYYYAGRMGGYLFIASRTKASTLAIPEGRLEALWIYEKKKEDKNEPNK